jgi:hypothetical protein
MAHLAELSLLSLRPDLDVIHMGDLKACLPLNSKGRPLQPSLTLPASPWRGRVGS